MGRAWTVGDVESAKLETMPFEGEWAKCFGDNPAKSGTFFIYGKSGHGKTSFTIQLAKYLCNFTKSKVCYNSLEEGMSVTIREAFEIHNMKEVKGKFILVQEHKDDLISRLGKKGSPDIVIIDSFQYFQLNTKQYIELRRRFPKKLFVFISHAQGRNPKGDTANFARYDANVKIWIEGYKAFPTSRFKGGGKPFVIYAREAMKYWGEIA